jgi:hypothetical protein
LGMIDAGQFRNLFVAKITDEHSCTCTTDSHEKINKFKKRGSSGLHY